MGCPGSVAMWQASAGPRLEACKARALVAAFCAAHKLPFARDHLLLRPPPHANLAFLRSSQPFHGRLQRQLKVLTGSD